MPKQSAQGQCLCGQVKVTVNKISNEVHACHCSMCRKWSGGPLMAVDCGNEVQFEGEQHIGIYNSSEWAERGFCKNCGTALFYRIKETQHTVMPIDLFSDVEGLQLTDQIFVDEQPEYYQFANETKKLTGAEVFAMYAPPG